MDRAPDIRMCTRSMAKAGNSSLLAPPKLSPHLEKHELIPPPSESPINDFTKHVAQNKINPSEADRKVHFRKERELCADFSANTAPANNSVPEEIPMECCGVSSPRSLARPLEQEFRAIDHSLVVCCMTCNVIYQRTTSLQARCPLCSAKKVHKLQYSEDLDSLQAALDTCAKQIKELQMNLEELKGITAHFSTNSNIDRRCSAALARLRTRCLLLPPLQL